MKVVKPNSLGRGVFFVFLHLNTKNVCKIDVDIII